MFFLACNQKKQNVVVSNLTKDSLSSYLSSANNFKLSDQDREDYTLKALNIISTQRNDSMYRVNLFKIANRYYNIRNWEEYKKTVWLVVEKSEISKDTVSLAKGYTYLGDYYVSNAISDSAFIYYYKAEKKYISLNDNYNLAKARLNKAFLQYNESDLLGSEITAVKALTVLKDIRANDIKYEAYNLLGLIYNELDEDDKAMEYHNKALNSIDENLINSVSQPRATSYNNIGYVYQNRKNFVEAKKYFQKGLNQKNLIVQKPSLYATLLDNLGYCTFKLNQNIGLPGLFYKSLKLRENLKLTSGIFVNKIHLAEYFASKKDITKALQYSKEALLLSRKTNNPRDILVALKQLAMIEPHNAGIYNKEYIRINEEIQKGERKMGDKFSRIEYETDQIKDENTDLETKNRNLLFGFSAITLVGLFIFLLKAQKIKNRELLFKQQQQKVNEEIYNLMLSQQNTIETNRVKEKKRVAQELHDGVLGRMFGVRMNLDGLNNFSDELAIKQRINYLAELKNIEQDIREISHDLNREKSELINNFVAIVDNLLEEQKKTHKARLITFIDRTIKWESVNNTIKINLYRIIQESLQNCNKYAEATSIKVEIKKRAGDLYLTVVDDGKGFDKNKLRKGIGLQNIQSRTTDCKGTFDIASKKGEGTSLTIIVPLENIQILT